MKRATLPQVCSGIVFGLAILYAYAPVTHAADAISTSASSQESAVRVVPGGVLPVTVHLTNFGSTRRVDVVITYRILDASGAPVLDESETVAVDTSASFVKQLSVPANAAPGAYREETSIQYPYQSAPAESGFPFAVERAYLGVFVSDWFEYGGAAFLLAIVAFVVGRLFVRFRSRRAPIHEYAGTPKNERIYYEMVSDTITQMRLRLGDAALDVARSVEGLSIDPETGRVLALKGDPAAIIAALVKRYEARSGAHVNFAARDTHTHAL